MTDDQEDSPEAGGSAKDHLRTATIETSTASSFLETEVTFAKLCHSALRGELCEALRKDLGFEHPTYVQSKVIPLCLEGKDVLVQASTGSGKTLAYLLPILQRLFDEKPDARSVQLKAVVLVPTRELCGQVTSLISCLLSRKSPLMPITVQNTADDLLRLTRSTLPSILVATPRAFIQYTVSKSELMGVTPNQFVSTARFLVVDEADLMIELGYRANLEHIFKQVLSARPQIFMCSATITSEVDYLQKLAMRRPVVLQLALNLGAAPAPDSASAPSKIAHYSFHCDAHQRYLVIYALIKLSLLPMACLLYVNSVDEAYKLWHFLHTFCIKVALITSETPLNVKMALIQSFNQGMAQLLIATDEVQSEPKPAKKHRRIQSDAESGLQRGIDFKNVRCVVNFDPPRSLNSYIHRTGRTARGENSGFALSFWTSSGGTAVHNEISQYLVERNAPLSPLKLTLADIQCFKYRVEDVLKTITARTVATLRSQDIQRHFLNSKVIKQNLAAAPEIEALKETFAKLQKSCTPREKHLGSVPAYFSVGVSNPVMSHDVIKAKIEALEPIEKGPRQGVVSELFCEKRYAFWFPAEWWLRRRSTKRRRLTSLLERQLAKQVNFATTNPERLPALSGRKLYAMQHHRPFKRRTLKKRRFSVPRRKRKLGGRKR